MGYETKLSDIIASLPEISGGFLYSPDQGVYSNQAETIGSDTALQHVSLKLTKMSSMLSVHFRDTGGIRITFKDLILFGMGIEEGHWLFLFHQPSLSPGMIKMTVQMALNIESEEVPQTPDVSPTGTGEGESVTEDLFDPGSELSVPLESIRAELAKYIGPVAELVIEDSVETWAAESTPSLGNLPGLIELLLEEIEREDDRNEFKDSLKSILGEG